MLMTLVPGVLFALVAVVLLVWYPLSKKVVLDNAATLNQRHREAGVLAQLRRRSSRHYRRQLSHDRTHQNGHGRHLTCTGHHDVGALRLWHGADRRPGRSTSWPSRCTGKRSRARDRASAAALREKQGAFGRFLDTLPPVATPDDRCRGRRHHHVAVRRNTSRQVTADVNGIAEQGGVILGRNGAYLLHGRADALHVKLVGQPDRRIANAARLSGIPVERAAKRQPHRGRLSPEPVARGVPLRSDHRRLLRPGGRRDPLQRRAGGHDHRGRRPGSRRLTRQDHPGTPDPHDASLAAGIRCRSGHEPLGPIHSGGCSPPPSDAPGCGSLWPSYWWSLPPSPAVPRHPDRSTWRRSPTTRASPETPWARRPRP